MPRKKSVGLFEYLDRLGLADSYSPLQMPVAVFFENL